MDKPDKRAVIARRDKPLQGMSGIQQPAPRPIKDVIGIVAEVRRLPDAPLSPLGSGHAFDLGSAECIETVHECNADLDFGGLAVRVA